MALIRHETGDDTDGVMTPFHEVVFDELIASFVLSDHTPGCVVAVQALRDGERTPWFQLARATETGWTSVPGQRHADVTVAVDVFQGVAPFEAYRLRVSGGLPCHLAACVTLGPPSTDGTPTPTPVAEIVLEPVSQMQWRGHGGEGWCSPTCLAMVLRRLGHEIDVPALAEAVRDPAYGCGNWSANVAYAASLGLDAVVERLGSLADARAFLEAGVPLVCSLAARPGMLPGFPLPGGTEGHLVVLAGVTEAGDPIVYDPAAPTAADVRRVYPRSPFERVWLEGSRGTVYAIRP